METINIYDISKTLPVNALNPPATRNKSDIDTVIIHHSAVHKAKIKSIAEYHVNSKNYPCISYHFIINHDNNIYMCVKTFNITFHTNKHNRNSIAVCFNFNYNDTFPNSKSLKLLYHLLYFLEANFNINQIAGHRFFSKTDSPGLKLNIENVIKNYYLWKETVMTSNHFKLNILVP